MKRIYLLSLVLTLVFIGSALSIDFPIRIIGNKVQDYKDIDGNIWFAAQTQYDKDSWGGWIERLPNRAEVRTLTPAAQDMAEEAGIDVEIFYAVSWQSWPNGVKMDVNTGPGTYDVTYLVGEHWSPNNRGYDIIIEDEIVKEAYVTPGANEIDILVFEGVKVKDKVMSFHFIGNPNTGKGDLNAMFSGLIIDRAGFSVSGIGKLPYLWGGLRR